LVPIAENSCVNLAHFAAQQRLLFADFFKHSFAVARPSRIFVIAADAKAITIAERLARRVSKIRCVEGKSFVDIAARAA
jgi:hypothetical protein